MVVDAKVLAHSRGPRIETLRYKSKKRVRVHRGGRADYTALEILAVGGLTVATGTEVDTETKPSKGKASSKRGAKAPEAKAEVIAEVETETKVEAEAEKPKRATRKKQDTK
jgi:ribosomal protein L21